jgi:hypothetical protein
MVGFNPVALSCVAVSLGVAVMLTVRTRKIAWGPAFIAIVLLSGYELLHVKWQEFIYIDDEKPIRLEFTWHTTCTLSDLALAFLH